MKLATYSLRSAPQAARVGALRDDPHRRMRSLHGLRVNHGLRELVVFTVVAEGFAREGLQHDVECLVVGLAGGVEVQPIAREFILLITAAKADVSPAIRQQIQRGDSRCEFAQ